MMRGKGGTKQQIEITWQTNVSSLSRLLGFSKRVFDVSDIERHGQGLNPYGDASANETREDAEKMLAESVRAKTYQDEVSQ